MKTEYAKHILRAYALGEGVEMKTFAVYDDARESRDSFIGIVLGSFGLGPIVWAMIACAIYNWR